MFRGESVATSVEAVGGGKSALRVVIVGGDVVAEAQDARFLLARWKVRQRPFVVGSLQILRISFFLMRILKGWVFLLS